jgi:hypothetical protein
MKKRRKKSYESSLDLQQDLNKDSDEELELTSSDNDNSIDTLSSNDENKNHPSKSSKSSKPPKKPKSDKSAIIVFGIVTIFIIIIFVLFKIPDSSNNNTITESMYNGYPLIKYENQWFIKVFIPEKNQSYDIEMRNSPFEVENISFNNISYTLNKIVNSQSIYLTVDPELSSLAVVGMIELSRVTGQRYDLYNIPTTGAITYSTNFTDPGTPIITCDNSTSKNLVILFELDSMNQIYLRDDCIVVSGKTEEDLVKTTDRLVYTLLGVIKE